MYEADIQNPQKVNVWTNFKCSLLGLFFIEDNLTMDNYSVMLRDTINKKCHHCNHEHLRKIPLISTNINILLQNGLSTLRKAILDTNYDKALTRSPMKMFLKNLSFNRIYS